jgi:phosphoglucosamine mutase
MVTGSGELIDGDQMAWLLALDRHKRGEKPEGLIGTQMSNGGLEQGLGELGIPFMRTPVGDKYMIREMKRTGWDLAAEASGHIIQRNLGPSGDGMATALSVLRALADKPETDRWSWRFSPWPLELINIKTKCRPALEECRAIQKAIKEIERDMGGTVRLVVRWSGTEPLLRLMAEAKDGHQVKRALDKLMEAAKDDMLV